jgi:hypothetical protein
MNLQTLIAIISAIAAITSAAVAFGSVVYSSGKVVKEVEALKDVMKEDVKPELMRLNRRIDDLYSGSLYKL